MTNTLSKSKQQMTLFSITVWLHILTSHWFRGDSFEGRFKCSTSHNTPDLSHYYVHVHHINLVGTNASQSLEDLVSFLFRGLPHFSFCLNPKQSDSPSVHFVRSLCCTCDSGYCQVRITWHTSTSSAPRCYWQQWAPEGKTIWLQQRGKHGAKEEGRGLLVEYTAASVALHN